MDIAEVIADRARETRALLSNLNSYYEVLAELGAEETPDPLLRWECARFIAAAAELEDMREQRRLDAEGDPVQQMMMVVHRVLAEGGERLDAPGIGAALEFQGWAPAAQSTDPVGLIEAACKLLTQQPGSMVRRTSTGEYVYNPEGAPAPERPRRRNEIRSEISVPV